MIIVKYYVIIKEDGTEDTYEVYSGQEAAQFMGELYGYKNFIVIERERELENV